VLTEISHNTVAMCVAGLNVSTQPCSHRWYELVRSCRDHRNLANCPDRLKLEGWEMRKEGCPWCDEQAITESTHRLFGSTSSASSAISTPTSPIFAATRQQRSGSDGTIQTLSRVNSISSGESERSQRHRDRNERFHMYLTSYPHEVLPSARKNYPKSPRDESPSSPESAAVVVRSGGLSKSWKKSLRFSRGMFGG
jgi:hypothetical protein